VLFQEICISVFIFYFCLPKKILILISNFEKTGLVGEDFSLDYSQLLEQIDYYTVKYIKNLGLKVMMFSENRPE
jgi:hypothetical protein